MYLFRSIQKNISFIAMPFCFLKSNLLLFLVFLYVCLPVIAQEKEEETIQTERVIVVKPYTPTISDAFKVKATPVLEDSIVQNKKEITYSIFSVPVASTFTPAKGKAENIDPPKKIPLFDNYATLGVGNYTSALAEFYSNFQVSRTDNIGVYLHHNSSQGGIDDVRLDDKFYNTFLDANYTSRTKDFTYGFEAGVEHQLYNWYGLPDIPVVSNEELSMIDPQQNYFGAKLGGKFIFEDLIFKNVKLDYRYFGDALSSRENRFIANSTLAFELEATRITTDVHIDFLKGNFERELQTGIENNYQILNLGVQPSFQIVKDDLSLDIGAEVVYSVDSQREENNLYFYPKVTASYRLINDLFIGYGGLEGGLYQNSYRDAVQTNPFVSPDLVLTPTHQQLEAYVGIKGKISDIISYNVRGSFQTEEDKPLFIHNIENRGSSIRNREGFDYGNSFSYRYDDIQTVSAYAELNFDINRKFKLGVTGDFYSYETDNEEKAWNLPEIKISISSNYQINEQWSAGAQLFYVGERFEVDNTINFNNNEPQPFVTIDSYLDANLNIGYRINEQWSVFAKGNNLLGNMYERWLHYPVQGIQVLGGVTYKFNW
ncbi:TonB-dependent receptor [Aquimarina sp. ERC-38]|uniref:TonB-dependent receptor n=1 Tax=Aquimarina sp. ERC-38 TaxID=2949996 RepID=UPI0022479A34|nr:TonB-dependent receptor [Aquimarina sp. ERC-38]UZO80893.1 TonB-dependent receptor [Aquimarina sp. ERC-38]